MGNGASARRKKTCPEDRKESSDPKVAEVTISPSPDLSDTQSSLAWLVGAIDMEKREKEWLAGKYDEKCVEIRELREELLELRVELNNARAASNEVSRDSVSRGRSRGMASPVVKKAQGDNASVWDDTTVPGRPAPIQTQRLAAPALPASPPFTPGGTLKNRRGLQLQVDTGPNKGSTAGGASSPNPAARSQVQKAPEVERSRPAPLAVPAPTQEQPLTIEKVGSSSHEPIDLRVVAQKVQNLHDDDPDCPDSPKRFRRPSLRSFE